MTCYNCGYEVSVVSKDDIGWLCEWCSDNDLRSPVIKRLKKRIEEKKANLDNFDDNRKTYTLKDIIVSELEELQKCLVENK